MPTINVMLSEVASIRPSPRSSFGAFPAPLSFLNAYDFRRDILAALNSSSQKVRLVVLEATGIVEIDFTAAQVLSDTINACRSLGVGFAIARLESARAQQAIEKFGIDASIETGRPFHSVEEAIRAHRGEAKTQTPTDRPLTG